MKKSQEKKPRAMMRSHFHSEDLPLADAIVENNIIIFFRSLVRLGQGPDPESLFYPGGRKSGVVQEGSMVS